MSLERVQPVEALPAEFAVETLLLLAEVYPRKVVKRHLRILQLVHDLIHDSLLDSVILIQLSKINI